MIGHSIGITIMLQLGGFQFSLNTAAYQELRRRTEHRWPAQERFGKMPALQYTGPGSDSITLTGTIFTEYRGGTAQLNALRSLAAAGKPQNLIDGTGKLLGKFVVESVEEGQSVFAGQGQPRKQEFTLQLRQFPDDALSAVAAAAGAVAAVASGGSLTDTKASADSFLGWSGNTISSAIGSMTAAMGAVQSKAAQIGNAVGPIVSTTSQAIRTASSLRQQVASTKDALKNMNSLTNIQSAMYGIMTLAGTANQAAVIAADTARASGVDLQAAGASSDAIQTVAACEASCGRGAVAATRTHSGANAVAIQAGG